MSLLPDRETQFPPLDPARFAPDPMTQFADWYAAAEASGVALLDVMALATASADGAPSVRMVLLKGIDSGGFRFFTNYLSRKGREMAANPRAALVFYWERLGRQVRAEGIPEAISAHESDVYFLTRPEGSRFAAAVSPQSEVIRDRAELEVAMRQLRGQHPAGDVPRPLEWGGYRLAPEAVEFWQQGSHRLHDRLRYRRSGDRWVLERLAP